MNQGNNNTNKDATASSTLADQLIALRKELNADSLDWSEAAISTLTDAINQTSVDQDLDMLSLITR